jgi:hypothetical protein
MQLKIWHKMIIGIAIPSFIAVLGGVLTYGYINDVRNRQEFVEIADDLKEHTLEMRRNEKNFLHFKNEEHLSSLNSALSLLTNSLSGITQDITKEIGEEDIRAINTSIQAYNGLIADIYRNYKKEAGITEEVRAEGRKLETFALKGTRAKELSINLILNLRRLEKNYMLFRDEKSLTELRYGLSQLENLIPFCLECKPYIEAIKTLANTYVLFSRRQSIFCS